MAQQVIGIGNTANDGTGDVPRLVATKANSNFSELYGELTAPVMQFEVTTGTLPLTRISHQGATLILSPGATGISFNAATQGNGFAFILKNRTGAAWTVPTFSGGTKYYDRGQAHTQIASGSDASFEVLTRSGVLYVEIIGGTQ